MGQYLKSLRTNILGIARFSGRESPSMFWPYVGTIFVLSMAVAASVMIPIFLGSLAKMQAYAVKHPEDATIDQGPGHYSITIHGNHPELAPNILPFIQSLTLMTAIIVILFAAAIVRRLHDTGRSGFWGILPLPFLTFSMSVMPRLFSDLMALGQPNFTLFFAVFFSNLAYLVCLVILLILLVQRGTVGPNRFGNPEDTQ